MPSDADLELAFYDKFLISRGLEPYPKIAQGHGHADWTVVGSDRFGE